MAQVEAHGAPKLRQCACASPVALVHSLPDDVLNHVQVLRKAELPLLEHLALCLTWSNIPSLNLCATPRRGRDCNHWSVRERK